MKYFSVYHDEIKDELEDGRIGLIVTPFHAIEHVEKASLAKYFIIDNGCYAHPYKFTIQSYIEFLVSLLPFKEKCLFATAEDVLGDAEATYDKLKLWSQIIRGIGFNCAFVAQDGLENMYIDDTLFDWLFVCGTTKWKMSKEAESQIILFKERGKKVHVGRVNSKVRFMHFAKIGADSADGFRSCYF